MVGFATEKDINALKQMWQSIFLEDEEITEYFFESLFADVVTPAISISGEIVSSLFLLDCKIGEYEGKCVYCAMTKYSHRGKGYMKELLDFSYDYCKNNDFDFLFLVPAEDFLFNYYEKCGFQKFGTSRSFILNDTTPDIKEKLKYQYKIEFDNSVIDYWKNSCIVYGGEITDFGLVFDDEEIVIRNASGDFNHIPEEYKKTGALIKGDITFGDTYFPAMIKTENEELKNIDCYIGVTLE